MIRRKSKIMKYLCFRKIICFCLILLSTSHIEAQPSELYNVDINDVISIKVLGHSNLDTILSVAADGTIAFPYLGNIYIKDMTLPDIEKRIIKKLSSGYIKEPVVSVSLIQALSKKVFIHGEVIKTGTFPFEKDMTIVKALSIAGGIRESGIYGKVKVRRKQEGVPGFKGITEAAISNGIIKDSTVEDMLLQPDDILIVERNESFFIQGEVTKPGQYVLEDNMTVSRAITVAGGISQGGLHGKIKVRRKRGEGPGYEDIEINLKGIIEGVIKDDMLLEKDDIVIIERSKTFLIYGEVNNIGEFPLEANMTVFKAITMAGGFNEWGSPRRVKVLRQINQKGNFVTIKVDINNVLNGDVAADILLQPGDIVVVTSGIF
jgi:polysaccharide export outer membrane protein